MGGERRTSEIACVVVSGWFEGKVEDSEGSPEMCHSGRPVLPVERRGVSGTGLGVKPGGWVWKCAQEYPGVEDGNSLKSTPGWRGVSPGPATWSPRPPGSRKPGGGDGGGGGVFRQDAAGSRLLRSCERAWPIHRPG